MENENKTKERLIDELAELRRKNEELEQRVAECNASKEAMRERQHLAQRIVDAAPDILYVYDLTERKNIYSNNQVTALLGYTPEEIQQMGPGELEGLVHPDSHKSMTEHLRKADQAKDGEVIIHEYRMRHRAFRSNGTESRVKHF